MISSSALTAPAAQIILALTPVVGIVIGGIIVFFYLLWHHHETKLEIKTGTYKPRSFNFKVFVLLTGILLIGVGSILTLLFILVEGLTYATLGGLIPLVLGICLVLFYKVNPDFRKKDGE